MTCKTPMCECAAEGHCPVERDFDVEEVQSGLRDLAIAIVKCEEHYRNCKGYLPCEHGLPCLTMAALQADARSISETLIRGTSTPGRTA